MKNLSLSQRGLIWIGVGLSLFTFLYFIAVPNPQYEQTIIEDLKHQGKVLKNLDKQNEIYKQVREMSEIDSRYINNTMLQTLTDDYMKLQQEYRELDPQGKMITINDSSMFLIIRQTAMFLFAPLMVFFGIGNITIAGIKHMWRSIRVKNI